MEFIRPEITLGDMFAVNRVLVSRKLAQGQKVVLFEQNFAKAHQRNFGVALNSGTSALHLALVGLGVGPGDKVIVPGISFAATANAVVWCGATPVFADIDSKTFNIDFEHASSLVDNKTKAVIPVDLFGSPVLRKELRDFASRHGLVVVIDSSQSHLANSGADPEHEHGFHATYSFYPTKNMTTGEGGMLVTNDPDLAERVRLLRNQGMSNQYQYEISGLNNRMTEMSAALGISQLRRLRKNTRRRREIAEIYSNELDNLDGVARQSVPEGSFSVYHQYTLVAKSRRDELRDALLSDGVPTRVYYPTPLNQIKPFVDAELLPNSTDFSKACLSLPIGPHISKRLAQQIISRVGRRIELGW